MVKFFSVVAYGFVPEDPERFQKAPPPPVRADISRQHDQPTDENRGAGGEGYDDPAGRSSHYTDGGDFMAVPTGSLGVDRKRRNSIPDTQDSVGR